VDTLGQVRWGTHLCLFCETAEDLQEILVPYFKAGLENREFCMWVTSPRLDEHEAEGGMREAVPDFDRYLASGQMEIVPHTERYFRGGVFDLQRVLDAWIDKLNDALARGYEGMRVTGNTAWLEEGQWAAFSQYEEALNLAVGKYRLIVVCTYCLDGCGAARVIDVVANHQFALIMRQGTWERIEAPQHKRAEREAASLAWFPAENPEPVLRVARDGLVIYANRSGESLLNAVGGGLGRPLSEPYRSHVLEALASGARREVEATVQDRAFALTFAPIVEAGYVNIYGTDITQRVQTQQALQEAEAHYRSLVENAVDMIYCLDRQRKVTYASPQLLRALGYTRKELLGRPSESFIAEEDRGKARTALERRMRGERVPPYEFGLVRRDGTCVPVEIVANAIYSSAGEIVGIQGMLRDTTDRQRASQALRESELRYRHLFENLNDAAVLADPETGIILDVNKQAEVLLGRPRDGLIGAHQTELHPPGKASQYRERFRRHVEKGQAANYVGEVVRKDGTIVPAMVSSSGTFTVGKQSYILGLFHDVSDRRRIVGRLRRSHRELRKLAAYLQSAREEERLERERLRAAGFSDTEIDELF
jgi:PAS domain S-box-containing protein